MSPAFPYAELHALSNFSFLRGASHPAELVMQAHALGYRALALTDECSLAGVVRAYEALRELPAESSFKLIIGAEFQLSGGEKLVLLAPSQAAYAQICQLITLGRRRSPKGEYCLTRADFEANLDQCLALWVLPRVPAHEQAVCVSSSPRAPGWHSSCTAPPTTVHGCTGLCS
jgi:error-prone DNA polymerase